MPGRAGGVIARRITFATIFAAFLLSTGVGQAETVKRNIGDVAEISVGDDWTFSESDQRTPDFSVYYVRNGGRIMLGIYVGNDPDIDIRRLSDKVVIASCGPVAMATRRSPNYDLDAVIPLRGANFPRDVHFFSRDLPAPDFARVQEIFKSFKTKQPFRCG